MRHAEFSAGKDSDEINCRQHSCETGETARICEAMEIMKQMWPT